MVLTIVEPAHSGQTTYYDEHPHHKIITIVGESIIIFIFCLETAMEAYHRKFDKRRSFKDNYILNFKMLFKILVTVSFLVDFIVFYSLLPVIIFRFSRLLRPGIISGLFYKTQ